MRSNLVPDPFDTDPLDQTWYAPLPATNAANTLLAGYALAGSTTATGPGVVVAKAATTIASAGITIAAGSVLAGTSQKIALSALFSVANSSADPAYLIVSGLDRDEYTVGYKTGAMGHLVGGSASQAFSDVSGDGWSVGVVFTYQASTGQYTNASYGALSALAFDTGSNLGDTATISLFGTSSASTAAAYAANALILAENPALFTNEGSVVVLTGAAAAMPPSTATPDGIAAAAQGYVGAAWNDNGCWVLASDISAKAGATLPLTSTASGMAGIANGEWIVAYNGPVSASSTWVNNLVTGEMVCFVTTSGGGHITTVESGSGQNAELIDNITLANGNGGILDSANDGSSRDVLVQAGHGAMQELSGVNAAAVVVYELDTPIVTAIVGGLSLSEGTSVSLSADFSASNPKAGQSVTEYQVYETSAADPLTLSGVADKTALSASSASTFSSLTTLGLMTAATTGTDTIEMRAFNGGYWGDWAALSVTVAPPAKLTATAAVAANGTSQVAVADTAANIGAAADQLQALAAAGRLANVTITGSGLVPVTAAQLTSDKTLLALLPSTAVLQVSGATVAQAAALQANAQVARFAITSTSANVSGQTALGADSKLAGITISGTTGADTLNLTGIGASVIVNLGGDSATASGGLGEASLKFLTPPDLLTLGAGGATISAGMSGSSGIETIANFQFGLDQLLLNLGTLSTMTAINTSYNGQHAIALTGGSLTQGVILLNQPSSVTAASLLASHIHTSNGVATVT